MKYDDKATLALLDSMKRLKQLTERDKKFSHDPEEIYNAVSVLHSISSALEDGANPNPIENVSLVGELCQCPLDGRVELSQTIKLAVAFGADLSIPDLTVQTNELPAVVRSPIAPMLEIGVSEEELRRRLNAVLTNIKPNTLMKLMRPVPIPWDAGCITILSSRKPTVLTVGFLELRIVKGAAGEGVTVLSKKWRDRNPNAYRFPGCDAEPSRLGAVAHAA